MGQKTRKFQHRNWRGLWNTYSKESIDPDRNEKGKYGSDLIRLGNIWVILEVWIENL